MSGITSVRVGNKCLSPDASVSSMGRATAPRMRTLLKHLCLFPYTPQFEISSSDVTVMFDLKKDDFPNLRSLNDGMLSMMVFAFIGSIVPLVGREGGSGGLAQGSTLTHD